VLENILLNLQQEIKTGTSLFDYIEESRKEFFIAVFSKVINGETIQYDRSYNRVNGQTIWINYIFNPVKENNQTVGICISGRDITAEKIAEQQK